MADGAALLAEARFLEKLARHHKSEVGRHRRALKAAHARLAEIAAECSRLGIAFNHHPQPGAGDAPWPAQTRCSTSQR